MADKCVVCGEADQGKPLYKKLGSGEYNIEIIEALRDLELTSLPESAKNDHYICWDCDETIVQEYGRYLEYEEKRKVEDEKKKEEKKAKQREQRRRRNYDRLQRRKEQQLLAPPTFSPIPTPAPAIVPTPPVSLNNTSHKNTKRAETQRANVHHSSHCVLCDSNFETSARGYYRYTLKKIVTDGKDVGNVMEVLGLARHVAPEMKSKRFVCRTCYYSIRRNYKNKVLKGTPVETSVGVGQVNKKKNPIHCATPDEHAAEIAKLLPPALAECYKIMTSNSVPTIASEKKAEDKSRSTNCKHSEEPQVEEEEEGMNVSQDEHGNYIVDMKVGEPVPDDSKDQNTGETGVNTNPGENQITPKTKKNVLLPKRHHHHLLQDENTSSTEKEQTPSEKVIDATVSGGKEDENTKPGESLKSRTCNICGRTFSGKEENWWHSLNSSLAGFETITISMALQLLETQLANTSEIARQACQVCLPCYGMVSSGFKSQVGQRIARKKNIDISQVNFGKVKIRMLRKEDFCKVDEPEAEGKQDSSGPENGKIPVRVANDVVENNKRKIEESDGSQVKKQKVTDDELESGANSDVSFPEMNDEISEGHLTDNDLNDPDYSMLKEMDQINKSKHKSKLLGIEGNNNVTSSNVRSVKEVPKCVDSDEKELSSVNEMTEVKKEKDDYTINADCKLFFHLSRMKEPSVVLSDIRNNLPREAFNGDTLLISDLPGGGYGIRPAPKEPVDTPFRSVLHSMLPPNWPSNYKENSEEKASSQESEITVEISGRCVVCASVYSKPCVFWHNLNENVQPPCLKVPICWVLASLLIAPVKLTPEDKEAGRVCEICYKNLTEQFEEFVREKIGESCGMKPSLVTVKDYIVTFNEETMNIEADPIELTPDEELEEFERILQSTLPAVQSFSMDKLLNPTFISPLSKNNFNVMLLMALNEFRLQLGLHPNYLDNWLTRLMPAEFHLRNLYPCEDMLIPFIEKLGEECDAKNAEWWNSLNQPLPEKLFKARSLPSRKKPAPVENLKSEVKEEEDVSLSDYSGESSWESFLEPVNMDKLFEGKKVSIANKDFNNGLLYSLWRVASMLGADNTVLSNWLKQLAPIPLEDDHIKLLLAAPKPIHDHLKKVPGDLVKLHRVIIPEKTLEEKLPKKLGKFVKADSLKEASNKTTLPCKKKISPKQMETNLPNKKKISPYNKKTTTPSKKKTVTPIKNKTASPCKKKATKATPVKKTLVGTPEVTTSNSSLSSSIDQPLQTTTPEKAGGPSALVTANAKKKKTMKRPTVLRKAPVTGNTVNVQEETNPDVTLMLSNQVQELQKQLLAMQRQNKELLQINQKLVESTSTDENEEVNVKKMEVSLKRSANVDDGSEVLAKPLCLSGMNQTKHLTGGNDHQTDTKQVRFDAGGTSTLLISEDNRIVKRMMPLDKGQQVDTNATPTKKLRLVRKEMQNKKSLVNKVENCSDRIVSLERREDLDQVKTGSAGEFPLAKEKCVIGELVPTCKKFDHVNKEETENYDEVYSKDLLHRGARKDSVDNSSKPSGSQSKFKGAVKTGMLADEKDSDSGFTSNGAQIHTSDDSTEGFENSPVSLSGVDETQLIPKPSSHSEDFKLRLSLESQGQSCEEEVKGDTVLPEKESVVSALTNSKCSPITTHVKTTERMSDNCEKDSLTPKSSKESVTGNCVKDSLTPKLSKESVIGNCVKDSLTPNSSKESITGNCLEDLPVLNNDYEDNSSGRSTPDLVIEGADDEFGGLDDESVVNGEGNTQTVKSKSNIGTNVEINSEETVAASQSHTNSEKLTDDFDDEKMTLNNETSCESENLRNDEEKMDLHSVSVTGNISQHATKEKDSDAIENASTTGLGNCDGISQCKDSEELEEYSAKTPKSIIESSQNKVDAKVKTVKESQTKKKLKRRFEEFMTYDA